MEDKAKNIIVIGREYGAGGRKIGKAVATMLGMDYFDKELINHISARYGYAPEILMRADEKKPSAFRSILMGKYGVMDIYGTSPMSREALYAAQADVIRQISSNGNCVIVGRTADYILRDQPGLTSVFVHAPAEWRAQNIIDRGETSGFQDALSKVNRADADREGFYNYFTGRTWGKASNYHFTLDSSLIAPEEAAEIIVRFATARAKGKS